MEMLLSFIATNIHYFLERIPKKSQQVQVNESTSQQVNEFFLGGLTSRTSQTSRTNQMGEHPIKLPRGDGIVLTSLTS